MGICTKIVCSTFLLWEWFETPITTGHKPKRGLWIRVWQFCPNPQRFIANDYLGFAE
ncbi:hypothetical protein CWATWH8502_2733 [Crocosphaera watsonii WH 8502]|uniref:Uncharacterized protein n=1 Tax=Crocosphaera watsonii WH 8502 TaxID=423474 RepID=T2IB06_CROWT|nr:hypothetical protein CWATWH8502_2733 [Crocosphaera watsonii WH 8502]